MLSLEKLSQQNKIFGIKLFFSYIIFTILLISSITVIHLYFSEELKNTKFKREATEQAEEKKKIFNNFFEERKHSIEAISKNPYFISYAKNGTFQYFSELLFYTVMEESREYMQLRFIDKEGNEKLRYDRKGIAKAPFKTNELQNKSDRYYFRESLALREGKVWISSLDLNMEYGQIQDPFVPVVRIATPLYEYNILEGVFVVNLFMEELLQRLTSSQVYDIYLVDKDGYFITHKNEKHSWSKYKDEKYTLKDEFGKKASLLILSAFKKREIYMNSFMVQPLDLDNQKLYLVMVEKESSIKEMQETNNFMIIAILFFSIAISIPFSMFFSKPIGNMYKVVLSQRARLKELAENLEKEVELESLKNAKKDRLLQHQSKLAELGDMIGNIAHQWRHPLTRLSLLLQNLKAYKNKGKMSDEVFNEALNNSLYQIDFMSTTIDNFKDFYRKDKEKTTFKVVDSLQGVLTIIGSVLDHTNIKIDIVDNESLDIYGNKNEFSQVLMNLIINAKDAIVENKTLDPFIKIVISKHRKKTKIEIIDNAGGVNLEIIEYIFNPYFTTKDEKGTGIGLYLCKVIIEDEMKGKITVSNYEEGANFTIFV